VSFPADAIALAREECVTSASASHVHSITFALEQLARDRVELRCLVLRASERAKGKQRIWDGSKRGQRVRGNLKLMHNRRRRDIPKKK
jgi:hypothetical protein